MVDDTQSATVTRPQIRIQNAVKSFNGRVVVDVEDLTLGDHPVAVVALDLDDAILEGAASTALLLEFFGQQLQLIKGQRHTGDQGHALTLAPLALTTDTYDAVTFDHWSCLLF